MVLHVYIEFSLILVSRFYVVHSIDHRVRTWREELLLRIDNTQMIRTFLQYGKPGFESLMLHSHTKNWMWISHLRWVPDQQTANYWFSWRVHFSLWLWAQCSHLWFGGLICGTKEASFLLRLAALKCVKWQDILSDPHC